MCSLEYIKHTAIFVSFTTDQLKCQGKEHACRKWKCVYWPRREREERGVIYMRLCISHLAPTGSCHLWVEACHILAVWTAGESRPKLPIKWQVKLLLDVSRLFTCTKVRIQKFCICEVRSHVLIFANFVGKSWEFLGM